MRSEIASAHLRQVVSNLKIGKAQGRARAVASRFRVRGHPQAQHAYAWSYKTEGGELRHVAVLGVPPIDSAEKAVKAAVMAHIEKQSGAL